jgi:hypothetical protein
MSRFNVQRRSRTTDRRRPIGYAWGWERLERRTLLSLSDPGFEVPYVGVGAFGDFRYQPTGSPWTFTGAAGVAGNGSGFTSGNPNAPDGTQVGFIQVTGTASQAFTWAGGDYTVSFLAAQRGNWQASTQTFQIWVDGNQEGAFTPAGTRYASYATRAFAVTGGVHTLKFVGLNPHGGDNTAFVDSVRINTATPPPQPPIGLNDPGFEVPYVGVGAWTDFQYQPSASPWKFTGAAGVAGNGSGFTSGNPNAPDGTQVAFIQETGTISQTFNWAAGDYTVSFQVAQRGNFQASLQVIQVLVDGYAEGLFAFGGTSYATFTSPGAFAVTGGLHTLKFVGVDPKGGDNTAFIDSVRINKATPPPPPPVGINDRGFEYPFVGFDTWSAFQYQPPASPWTFTGAAGIAGDGSGFTSGNPNAPDGTQAAFLQETGTISQAFNWTAGIFTVSFRAAQRGNWQASTQTFQVWVDGNLEGTFTPAGTSYASYTTNVFAVTGGVHTLKFVGLDPKGGDNTAFIDSVQVNPATPPPVVHYPITATIVGNTIYFQAFDTQRGQTVQTSASIDGTFLALGNTAGMVAWDSVTYNSFNQFDHNTVAYATYDSVHGTWAIQSSRVDGSLIGGTNQNDQIAWASATDNAFGQFDHDTVAYTTYDAIREAWMTQSWRVDGSFIKAINNAAILSNAASVIVWASVSYDAFGRFDHNTVAYTTYDEMRGTWMTQSSRVTGVLGTVSDQNNVVSWTYSVYDTFGNLVGTFTQIEAYDPKSGTWKGSVVPG